LAAGFHDPEPEARHRWTTGFAPLPHAVIALFDGPIEVTLGIVCTGKYPLRDLADAACVAAA
jgi:hypothetical protein